MIVDTNDGGRVGAALAASPSTGQDARPGQRLKICLLGYRSAPYSGGQGIYIRYLSRALRDAGHEVHVISGQPYPHLDSGIRLIEMPSLNLFEVPNHVTALRPRHLLSYTDFFEWFSMLTGGFPEPYTFGRRVVHYLRHERHDYDIIHDNQSLCYGLLSLRKMGFTVVTTVHHPITSDLAIALRSAEDWRARLLLRRWHSFLTMQKRVLRKLNNIVSVSDSSRRDTAAAFAVDPAHIEVVHNGIDTDQFRPLPDVPKKPFRLITTASADVPLKGLIHLLRALALLRRRYPQLELTVVGSIKEDGEAYRFLTAEGLAASVSFRSNVSTETLVELYAEAEIAVCPSIYEGFGFPAGEAMACAVPLVSTTGGALPEVVGDAGILVSPGKPRALAEAISALLEDPAERRRLAHAGRERMLKRFTWQLAAERMTQYYRQVIADANAHG